MYLILAKVLEKPDAILLNDIFQKIAQLGAVHPELQPVPSPYLAKVLQKRRYSCPRKI